MRSYYLDIFSYIYIYTYMHFITSAGPRRFLGQETWCLQSVGMIQQLPRPISWRWMFFVEKEGHVSVKRQFCQGWTKVGFKDVLSSSVFREDESYFFYLSSFLHYFLG